jgi:hypothetical protein
MGTKKSGTGDETREGQVERGTRWTAIPRGRVPGRRVDEDRMHARDGGEKTHDEIDTEK